MCVVRMTVRVSKEMRALLVRPRNAGVVVLSRLTVDERRRRICREYRGRPPFLLPPARSAAGVLLVIAVWRR